MNYRIKIYEDALNDIKEAATWYNNQLVGLGQRFKKQIKSQINGLKKYPFGHEIKYSGIRCMPVTHFPFLVHYLINETQHAIEIYAVFHTSRNPRIWKKRDRIIRSKE